MEETLTVDAMMIIVCILELCCAQIQCVTPKRSWADVVKHNLPKNLDEEIVPITKTTLHQPMFDDPPYTPLYGRSWADVVKHNLPKNLDEEIVPITKTTLHQPMFDDPPYTPLYGSQEIDQLDFFKTRKGKRNNFKKPNQAKRAKRSKSKPVRSPFTADTLAITPVKYEINEYYTREYELMTFDTHKCYLIFKELARDSSYNPMYDLDNYYGTHNPNVQLYKYDGDVLVPGKITTLSEDLLWSFSYHDGLIKDNVTEITYLMGKSHYRT
jgi:hypothetical protein